MEVTFKLDTKKTVSRLYFLVDENTSEMSQLVTLELRKRVCKRNFVYLQVLSYSSVKLYILKLAYFQPTFKDKLSPLEVQMSYKIQEEGYEDRLYGFTGDQARLKPVIDPRQNLLALSDSAYIQKDCGFDNICIPELSVTYQT